VINLGIGSPDLPPPEEAVNVFRKSVLQPNVHGYQSYTGIPELRNAFAEWYHKWYGVVLHPNTEIQPLIGSKEGILHISLAFLNPGDKALIPNPGYPTYSSVSNLVNAAIIYYDLNADDHWYPDWDALENMDLSGVKLMWTNYPNMPTGASACIALYEKLVDFGKRKNIIICNDNPYSFILNEKPLSILSIEGAKSCCIELNSMSKSHNMPGWRMAMLASNAQFVGWILKVKSNIDSGQFRPMMLAAATALNCPSEWYQEMNAIYRKRRVIAEQIMNEMDCTFDENQSGMFLWGRIPDRYQNSGELADKILYDANVFITPGFIFGSNGRRFVRISLCCKEPVLKETLERIKNLNK
jgi:aspartate/methionine/tyrosine aminotransferase